MADGEMGNKHSFRLGVFASDVIATQYVTDLRWTLTAGMYYYNTTDHSIRVYNGTAFELRSGAFVDKTFSGFPNRTDSALSFDNGNKRFTIAPTAGTFSVYQNGVEYVKGAETVDIPDPPGNEGAWYIYYSVGVLGRQLNTDFDFATQVPVAIVYWDATNLIHLNLQDERHGIVMDWNTHEYLHETVGTRYASGLGISGSVAGTGALDIDAQIALDDGVIFDEDIQISIRNGFPQVLTPVPAEIPVWYRDGASAWRRFGPSDFPAMTFDKLNPPVGATRLAYNLLGGGLWTQPVVPDTQFVAMWIVATSCQEYPIIAILGQRVDATLVDARNNNTPNSIAWGNQPYREMKLIYRLIFETDSTYTNLVLARDREMQDYRNISNLPIGAFVPAVHGALAGLQVDDHNNVYPRIYGRDGSLATYAALLVAYPPGVLYRNMYAIVRKAGGDEIYQCQWTGVEYLWIAVAGLDLPYTNTAVGGLITPFMAGTVVNGLTFDGVCVHSSAVTLFPNGTLTPGNSHVIDFGGGNTLTIAVTAGGAITLVSSAGTTNVNLLFRVR